MITGDTNIVDVEMIVQYRVKDIIAYLFNVSDPGVSETTVDRPDGRTLKDATEAALRQVVGSRTLTTSSQSNAPPSKVKPKSSSNSFSISTAPVFTLSACNSRL